MVTGTPASVIAAIKRADADASKGLPSTGELARVTKRAKWDKMSWDFTSASTIKILRNYFMGKETLRKSLYVIDKEICATSSRKGPQTSLIDDSKEGLTPFLTALTSHIQELEPILRFDYMRLHKFCIDYSTSLDRELAEAIPKRSNVPAKLWYKQTKRSFEMTREIIMELHGAELLKSRKAEDSPIPKADLALKYLVKFVDEYLGTGGASEEEDP